MLRPQIKVDAFAANRLVEKTSCRRTEAALALASPQRSALATADFSESYFRILGDYGLCIRRLLLRRKPGPGLH
jgi:hypothetical protein